MTETEHGEPTDDRAPPASPLEFGPTTNTKRYSMTELSCRSNPSPSSVVFAHPESWYSARSHGSPLGQATDVAKQASDTQVVETLGNGATDDADGTVERRVGLSGQFSALHNSDVRSALGSGIRAAEGVGGTREPDPSE